MKKAKILIVEDEIIIGMEIAERLKSMNYEVVKVVMNAEEALKAAIELKPNLILMDIILEGSIDGIEATKKIRQKIDIPVIYLTANTDNSTIDRAKVSDAFGYLVKPFDERELNTTIEMVLYKHQMELRLKESRQKFQSLVEYSAIGIFRFSKNGRIYHANPTFKKILGYEKTEEVLNKSFDQFLDEGKEKQSEIIKILNEKGVINKYRVNFLSRDKKIVPVNLNGNIIKLNNKVAFFDGTIEDISLQLKFEEQILKAKEAAEEADKLKTEFLAGMSHEIRTPVNTILNYLSLLNEEMAGNDESNFNDFFDSIKVGSKRLLRTIDSILNMAQFQAGTFDAVKTKIDLIDEVLQSVFNEFKATAKHKGVDLYFNNFSEHTGILGDAYSVIQLFVNLVDNAIKYTKEGFVNINVYNDSDGVLSVTIEDSGIGIEEKFLPTLFNPFSQEEKGYTKNIEGNGLGLALVKKYCELNDAVIKVKSIKGRGTRFTVKFSQTNKNNEYKTATELKSI